MQYLIVLKQGSIEEQKIHDGSLDVLAHHLVGMTMQLGEISVNIALETINNAYPFRNLHLEDLLGVLDLLDSNYLIFFDRTKMTFLEKRSFFQILL